MDLKRVGVRFDRVRVDLNENFDKIEGKYKGLQNRFDNAVDEVSDKAFDKVVDRAKIEWLPPVDTFDDLATTYPNATEGQTSMVRDTGKIYRMTNGVWMEIQDIDPTAINDLDKRLGEQWQQGLAYTDASMGLLYSRKRSKGALVSFISDDGKMADYTKLKPIVESKGVPIGLGIVTSWMGTTGFMNPNQLKEMESLGFEIMSHSHTHQDMSKLTPEQLREEFGESKRILRSLGLKTRLFVYPFNSTGAESRKVLPNYFEGGFAKYGWGNGRVEGLNTPNFRNIEIGRNALGSYFDTPREGLPQDTSSLEYYKALVDEAERLDNWLVFVLHPDATNDTQLEYLSQTIDYIKSKGIEIVSPSEGFDRYGNIIEVVGDSGELIVNAGGVASGNSLNVIIDPLNSRPLNTPVTSFQQAKITYSPISNSYAQSQGYPEGRGGIAITYRISSEFYNAYQEFVPLLGSQKTYKRFVNADYTWGQFDESRSYVYMTDVNRFSSSSRIGEFRDSAITYTPYTTAGATSNGMPRAVAGILKTERIFGDYWAAKQTYTTSKAAEPNGWEHEFVRYGKRDGGDYADGDWTDWVLVKGVTRGSTAYLPTRSGFTPDVGYMYMATDINKVVWYDGSKWIDAMAQAI